MTDLLDLAVVIPTFNEQANVPTLVAHLDRALDGQVQRTGPLGAPGQAVEVVGLGVVLDDPERPAVGGPVPPDRGLDGM